MRLPLELPAATDRAVLAAALTALGTSVLRGVSEPPVLGVYRLAIAESVHAPEVAHALATARAAGRAALARMLTQAQADGLIGAGDPATMAVEFFALLWGDLLLQLPAARGGAAQIADAGTEGARGDGKISAALSIAARLEARTAAQGAEHDQAIAGRTHEQIAAVLAHMERARGSLRPHRVRAGARRRFRLGAAHGHGREARRDAAASTRWWRSTTPRASASASTATASLRARSSSRSAASASRRTRRCCSTPAATRARAAPARARRRICCDRLQFGVAPIRRTSSISWTRSRCTRSRAAK